MIMAMYRRVPRGYDYVAPPGRAQVRRGGAPPAQGA